MHLKKPVALLGATVLAVLGTASGSAAKAGAPVVSVRIEGLQKTLLKAKTIDTHAGSITKGGAPSGACPASHAAGALDVATHHNWSGTYSASQRDIAVTTILGETHTFSSPYFWDIFLNNKPATTGACGLALHRGDKLVFAAVSSKNFNAGLLAIRAPKTVRAGQAFTVKVVRYTAAGAPKPLAGAKVHTGSTTVSIGAHGTATLTAGHAGTLVLHADHAPDVRAAAVRVRVAS